MEEVAQDATRGVPDGTPAVMIAIAQADAVFVATQKAFYDVLVRSARFFTP